MSRNRRGFRTGTRFVFGIDTKPMKFKGFKSSGNPFRGAILMQEGGILPKYQNAGIVNNSDEERTKLAELVVKNARERIKNDNFVDVPENIKKIAEERGEGAYSCIGGVCTVLKDSGVIPNVTWSNTEFAKKAKEYGFRNEGYGIKNIKNLQPGDVLQHLANSNEQGNYYPSHAQIYLGRNENGEMEFFDNYAKGIKKYNEDELKEWLSPERKKNERQASIYKVNPYSIDSEMTPEAKKAIQEREKTWEFETGKGFTPWQYSIREDATDIKGDNKYVKSFLDFANNSIKKEQLARSLNVSISDVDDELLNTFGELGQETKFGTHKSAETIFENIFKPKNKSIGPGQIRFSTLAEDLKQKFGINKPKDLYNEEKLIPLMTAINLRNRQYLKNKGDKLSEGLMGEEGVDWKNIRGGIGRWTPYMYQFGRLDSPEKRAGRKLRADRQIFGSDVKGLEPTEQEKAEYYNNNKRVFQFNRDEGSYADAVFGYIDRNLQRVNPHFNAIQPLQDVEVVAQRRMEKGGVIIDPMGQWNHPYQETIVPTQDGRITMKNVPYPVQGIDLETGESQLMMPNKEYKFRGKNIYEIPLLQQGGRIVSKSEYDSMLSEGYIPIGNNKAVRQNPFLDIYFKGVRSNKQASVQEWEKIMANKIRKGLPYEEAVSKKYGTEQGLKELYLKYQNTPDTITYKTQNNIPNLSGGYEPFRIFKPDDFNKSFMVKGDTLYYPSNMPQSEIDKATFRYSRFRNVHENKIIPILKNPAFVDNKKKPSGDISKMQQGGFSLEDIYKFLFDDEEETTPVTAPSTEEINDKVEEEVRVREKKLQKDYAKKLRSLNRENIMKIIDSSDNFESFISGQRNTTQNNSSNFAAGKNTKYIPTVSKAQATEIAYQKGSQAVKYLQETYGLPKHVAAGIAGNAMQESSFRDDVIGGSLKGDSNQSFGLFQWYKDRKNPKNDRVTPFFNWVKQNNRNPYDMYTQLDYGIYEAKQRGDLQQVMKAENATQAANIWRDRFERPAVRDNDRAAYANRLMQYQIGGVYDVDDNTVAELKRKGYKFKIV